MKNKTFKKGISTKQDPYTNQTTIKVSILGVKGKSTVMALSTVITPCNSHSIIIEPLLKEFKCPILLVVNHPNLQTQLDMTGVSNQTILSFDQDGVFIGAGLIGKNGDAPMQFLNLGRLILIASMDMHLTAQSIICINYK
jgi:hypothetical protein